MMKNENKNFQLLKEWIVKDNHPCIMAQTVFKMDMVDYHEYAGFGSKSAIEIILSDLEKYIASYDFSSNDFFTFIASFPNETEEFSEKEFEKLLWRQLQYLHDADDFDWDPEVNSNPEDENFSFSIKGRAFYVVGLHKNSSRKARQTLHPTIVFNLHSQFEKLREMNSYHKVRDRIRKRDIKLQGDMNPMLEDFGEDSEAKQYSGRKVEQDWKCPFQHKK